MVLTANKLSATNFPATTPDTNRDGWSPQSHRDSERERVVR